MKCIPWLLLLALFLARPHAAFGIDWQTKLEKAAFEGDEDGVKRALDHGAQINAASAKADGRTALEAALVAERKDMFLFLLGHGADPDLADAKGLTPLMLVAREHLDVEYAQALVYPGGASLDLADAEGRTAADIAKQEKYSALYFYLSSKDAEIDHDRAIRERGARQAPPPPTIPAPAEENVYDLGKPLNRGPLHPVDGAPKAAVAAKPKPVDPNEVLFPAFPPFDRPYFSSLRIDADVLHGVAGAKPGKLGVTAAELDRLVAAWFKLGIRTIVLAHTERANRFYYKPKGSYSYKTVTYRDVPGGKTIRPKGDPTLYDGALLDGEDFLTSLMKSASKQYMKVVLGLSPPGDTGLLEELDADALHTKPGEPGENLLKPNVDNAVAAAFAEAKDLFGQYGALDSFGGFYLGPPALCVDGAMKFYGPLARKLRKLAKAPKKVTISVALQADARACAPKSDHHRELKAYEDAVDSVIYVDGLGTARYAAKDKNGPSYLEFQKDCGGQECHFARLKQLGTIFEALRKFHAGTKITPRLESQGWRRLGKCTDEATRGYPEDCPQLGLAGSWAKDLQTQLNKERELAGGADKLVLSEGLGLFDFKIRNLKATRRDVEENSRLLTDSYLSYLGAPKPGQSTATETSTSTGVATETQTSVQDTTRMEDSQVLCTVTGLVYTADGSSSNLPQAQTTFTIPKGKDFDPSAECARFALSHVKGECPPKGNIRYNFELQRTLKDGTGSVNREFHIQPCSP